MTSLPKLTAEDALFLDFDGTLVDLAPTPDKIEPTPDLTDLLSQAKQHFDGAVCLVTGRQLDDLKHYVPVGIDVAAEHGAVVEVEGHTKDLTTSAPRAWEPLLKKAERNLPGLMVERKGHSVSLHYRQNPDLEDSLVYLGRKLCTENGFRCIVSNYTVEVLHQNMNKGEAIRVLMQQKKYRNRRPVFVADDLGDVPGFEAVLEMHGLALHVGTDFAGETARVRRWLWDEIKDAA